MFSFIILTNLNIRMYEKKQMKNLILIRFEIEVLRMKMDHVERNTIIRLSSGKGNPSVKWMLVTKSEMRIS